MSAKVKISDIIEAMEDQFDELGVFVNIESGEVAYVQKSFLRMAEDGEPYDGKIGWQQEQMEIAEDIIEHEENYLVPPSKFEIHEYSMMEDYCYLAKNGHVRDVLLYAINGRGAFRRFKDQIFELDLEDDWYAYRDQCYKEIAIEFCERNNLEYMD